MKCIFKDRKQVNNQLSVASNSSDGLLTNLKDLLEINQFHPFSAHESQRLLEHSQDIINKVACVKANLEILKTKEATIKEGLTIIRHDFMRQCNKHNKHLVSDEFKINDVISGNHRFSREYREHRE